MLTQEQIDGIRAKSGLSTNTSNSNIAGNSNITGKYDYLIKPNFINRVQNVIGDAVSSTQEKAGQVKADISSGQTPLSALPLRTAGVGASFVNKAVGGVLGETAKTVGTGIAETFPEQTAKLKDYLLNSHQLDVVDKIAPGAKKALSLGIDAWNSFKKLTPEGAKSVEDIVDIATAVPIFKGATVAKEAALEGATKGIKPLLKAGKYTKTEIGSGLERLGGEIQGIAPIFKPNTGEALKTITEKAKKPLTERLKDSFLGTGSNLQTIKQTAVDHGLAGFTEGQIAIQAKRTAGEIWKNTINPVLESIKETVVPKDIFNKVRTEIAKEADLTMKVDLLKGLKAVEEDYSKVKNWTYLEMQDLKSALTKKLPSKVWRGQDVTGTVNNIRKLVSDELRTQIQSKIPNEVKNLYKDYGNLGVIVDRGASSLTKAYIEGGAGKLFGEIIRTSVTPISTIGGKIIRKAGQTIK